MNTGIIFREPDLHDGHWHGIRVMPGSTLRLHCSSVDEKQYVVLLPGLHRLRADNFLQGNIIFELIIFSEDYPLALVQRVFGLDADEQPAWLLEQIATMSRERWTLLELTGSYGCELVAIGRGPLTCARESHEE